MVYYDNLQDTSVHLAAELTLPEGKGPFPAVVLITGSGQSAHDNSFYGHRYHMVLADYLTRYGIAVLNFDDRGAGKSTLGSKKISDLTMEDFISDTYAGVHFLESKAFIDQHKIGVLGHSEGTAIAQEIGARYNKEIAFIILNAGAPYRMTKADIVADQSRIMNRLDGYPRTVLHADSVFVTRCINILKQKLNKEERVKKMSAIATEELSKLSEADQKLIEQAVRERVQILSSENFYEDFHKPRHNFFKDISCPVLALNGGKDVLIDPVHATHGITASFKEAKKKNGESYLIPGINHMMQTANTGMFEEVKDLKETMSPLVLEKISSWLLKIGMKPQAG